MKRAILFILIGALIGGGGVWFARHGADKADADGKPAAKPAEEEESKITVTRDTNGNAVINISDETQGDAGILVKNPAPAQSSPEAQGYGRVLDPAPLLAFMSELAMAQTVFDASSNELIRLKTLAGGGNASTRAVQAAEAAALHDQLAIQSARDRLALSWGKAVANRSDLPAFIQSLAAQDFALVRLDLPAGETLPSPPTGARVVAFSGHSAAADFLGAAPGVDAQTQGRGFLFLIKSNASWLLPGEGLTGYLELPGQPQEGVVIPRAAVIRAEGKGWVYVLNAGGESFTRKEIALDHPTEAGWFVIRGVSAGDYLVVTGAQTIYSAELSGSGLLGGGE